MCTDRRDAAICAVSRRLLDAHAAAIVYPLFLKLEHPQAGLEVGYPPSVRHAILSPVTARKVPRHALCR